MWQAWQNRRNSNYNCRNLVKIAQESRPYDAKMLLKFTILTVFWRQFSIKFDNIPAGALHNSCLGNLEAVELCDKSVDPGSPSVTYTKAEVLLILLRKWCRMNLAGKIWTTSNQRSVDLFNMSKSEQVHLLWKSLACFTTELVAISSGNELTVSNKRTTTTLISNSNNVVSQEG